MGIGGMVGNGEREETFPLLLDAFLEYTNDKGLRFFLPLPRCLFMARVLPPPPFLSPPSLPSTRPAELFLAAVKRRPDEKKRQRLIRSLDDNGPAHNLIASDNKSAIFVSRAFNPASPPLCPGF